MSGPDKPDPTRPWMPPARDQAARRQDEHERGAQSVRPEEPTVVARRRQGFIHPRYSPSQQPGRSAYPSQHQPGAPHPPAVGPSQARAPGQQYGVQPPVYGQPPFGPQQGGFAQPGQFGHFETGLQRRSSRRSTAVLGGAVALLAVAIVAVVLVLGLWTPGFLGTTKLDVYEAQTGVQQVLTDPIHGYGVKNVNEIMCNSGQNPTVKKDDTFICEVRINGTKRQVTVTFQDDDGNYDVGRPS